MIGEAVSQAVSLCDQATPGVILCDEGTARLIWSTAQVEALSPQTELQAGERVYQVQRLTSTRTEVSRVGERTLTDFVNRERELEQLIELLSEVETGRGHAVGVVGKPGIGKSRLTHELQRRMTEQSFAYLQGRCLSYGVVTPYLERVAEFIWRSSRPPTFLFPDSFPFVSVPIPSHLPVSYLVKAT
ncbi:hypothetical protein C2W62_44410, partial [Candidatus Entotheonella serta]